MIHRTAWHLEFPSIPSNQTLTWQNTRESTLAMKSAIFPTLSQFTSLLGVSHTTKLYKLFFRFFVPCHSTILYNSLIARSIHHFSPFFIFRAKRSSFSAKQEDNYSSTWSGKCDRFIISDPLRYIKSFREFVSLPKTDWVPKLQVQGKHKMPTVSKSF